MDAIRKIVVADDEPHIRYVLEMKLMASGYEVHVASDGEEALEMCKSVSPDLLITDFQMPFMSGVELCLALRQDPATAAIPALMLSARGFDVTDQQRSDGLIRAVLSKPFSPGQLKEKVQELLEPEQVGGQA